MHFCQDEAVAVASFFSAIPFAWRWLRMKIASWRNHG